MAFERRCIYRVTCEICKKIEETEQGRDNKGCRAAAGITFKDSGWKRAQRKVSVWGNIDWESGEQDYKTYTRIGWFCSECVKAGMIPKWHEIMKRDYPVEDE